jgi:hypothetical protein
MIPNSVTRIEPGAFENCRSLLSITMSDNLTHIQSHTFADTSWFAAQPNGVVYIGRVAYMWKGLIPPNTSYSFREDTVAIAVGFFAHYSRDNVISVTIPDGVISIGGGAFRGTSITTLTIPDSVIMICCCSFTNTPWFEDWFEMQPYGVVYMGRVAVMWKASDNVSFMDRIPPDTSLEFIEGTTGISGYFSHPNITSIVIPNSVVYIGNAFSGSSLVDVHIPDSVRIIADGAFAGIDSLSNDTQERIRQINPRALARE